MKTHITRLIEHMIWADNIHWSMFNSDEKYLQDKQLFEKLFHIHFVQFAFLNIVTKTPLERKRPTDFTPESYRNWQLQQVKNFLILLKILRRQIWKKGSSFHGSEMHWMDFLCLIV
jgi:hypothetical protein